MVDALTKLLALFIGIKLGVMFLFTGSGVLGVLLHWAWGIFMITVAVGFWKKRGWAFLVVSVGLLVGWFVSLITFILAVDQLAHVPDAAANGVSVWPGIISWVLVMVLIAVFGRWNVERKFRPHLDTDH